MVLILVRSNYCYSGWLCCLAWRGDYGRLALTPLWNTNKRTKEVSLVCYYYYFVGWVGRVVVAASCLLSVAYV